MRLSLLLLFCAAAAVTATQPECSPTGPRVPCGAATGSTPLTEQDCLSAGCCWLPPDYTPEFTSPGGPQPKPLPTCITPNARPSTYTASSLEQGAGGGITAQLSQSAATHPELGADIASLKLEAVPIADNILRVRITDAQQSRWEVPPSLFSPDSLLARLASPSAPAPAPGSALAFGLTAAREPFSLVAGRPGGAGGELLNTTATRLVFKDQYIEFSTALSPSAALFGGGSANRGSMQIPRDGYPLVSWNRDLRTAPRANLNSYSTNTLIMSLDGGQAHGYFMLSSNGLEVSATPDTLTWRMICGIVDLFVLAGPTPRDVLSQLAALVGRPAMPPMWALGLHNNLHYNAYKNCSRVPEVVANYSAAGIPVEAFDSNDYMDSFRLFTLSPSYANNSCLADLVDSLHARGQKWLPWVLPAIKLDPNYTLYKDALAAQALMLDAYGRALLGQSYPGPSVFLDFASPKGVDVFKQHMKQFYGTAPFDGWHIGYEEPTSFCSGDVCQLTPDVVVANLTGTWDWDEVHSCPWCGCNHVSCASIQCNTSGTCTEHFGLGPDACKLANPPYTINSGNAREGLGSVSLLSHHTSGARLYDTHNVFGTFAAKAVRDAQQAIQPEARPFVRGRATFPGASAYVATSNGNECWACGPEDAAMGPAQVLNMGLSGFPFAGSAISCQQDPFLCAAWIGVAAWFPYMKSADQELYKWNETIAAARTALALRFSLLPYIYSLAYEGHARGWPMLRPLWMVFANDPAALALPENVGTHDLNATSWQFMVGDAVLVSPAVSINATQTAAYFPKGLWYNVWNWSEAIDARQGPLNLTLAVSNSTDAATNVTTYYTPAHIRGGSILPMQLDAFNGTANTTAVVKASPLSLLLVLPDPVQSGNATAPVQLTGMVYNDDGSTVHVGADPCNFLLANATLNTTADGRRSGTLLLSVGGPAAAALVQPAVSAADAPTAGPQQINWPQLAGINVLGWHANVSSASLNEMPPPGDTSTPGRTWSIRSERCGYLHLPLRELGLPLRCGGSYQLAWSE